MTSLLSPRALRRYAALLVMLNGFFPALWILFTSFKTEAELTRTPITWLPHAPTLANYITAFHDQPLALYLFNSVAIALLSTALTIVLATIAGHAGGDYWTTNYPQPTFLSSRRYALHVDTTAYACFDFRRPDRHRVEAWEIPARIELWSRPDLPALVGAMADRFGRPPPLPDWVYAGAIIGLKDGERSFARLDAMIAAGVRVSGLWCEDWVGLRHTSFGARLFWDWRADERRYPGLPARIAALRARGMRFLGYVNPYLCDDGTLFGEAEAAGYLATDATGGPARVDFGEFTCGVVDFTSPGAADWFAERVLGQNMLDAGLSGWMADFGEYLPTDIRLADGDPLLLHNAWPTLWAAVNARALASRGMAGEALFFMRAGRTGVQAHCPLLWGGDRDLSPHRALFEAARDLEMPARPTNDDEPLLMEPRP